MGPSGAGKTVLISTLTLDALFGKATGSVTLNGVPLTDEIFKQHAYVVVQKDKLWPYLTCRETMRYAAELYAVGDGIDNVVDTIIDKLGLRICCDTRNARLSGGQQRRLSLGLALLKNPTLLFLGT
jgi:ABC-type multidrug transport system ATPase subunit